MGKVMSVVARKAKRFNVENRAHRLLDKDKLNPAPRFESNFKDMQRVLEEIPDYVEKQSKKDAALDNRLKQVYVTSEDTIIDLEQRQAQNPNRPLPLDRTSTDNFEFGFQEPTRVTPGRCTLRQAMQFIAMHNSNPDVWTKGKIATDYKLKEETVAHILEYYRSFQMHIPDPKRRENILKPQPKGIKSITEPPPRDPLESHKRK